MTHTFRVFKGSPSGTIHPTTTTRPALTSDDVLVHITASGICGTDLHYRTSPIALGHEGVGRVAAVGPAVTHLRPGDRVGWGYIHDTCGRCAACLAGDEQYCASAQIFGYSNTDQGSFGEAAVWRERFLFPIPDALSDEEAAPLMCAGATVFNALQTYGARATHCVGVVGVGGLGHLAIKFAARMGCDVVVFSGTDAKRADALDLGAAEFHRTSGATKIETGKKLDFLLVTASVKIAWELYLPLLAPGATILPLSMPDGDLVIPCQPIVFKGLRIQGTVVSGRHVQNQTLEFAARHRVAPVVQKYPMTTEGISQALADLENGSVRYRAVLVPQKA